MFYVYLLMLQNKHLYIGYSADLELRYYEQTRGDVHSTRDKHPKLVCYEAYNREADARKREQNLKQFGSAYQGLIKRLDIR